MRSPWGTDERSLPIHIAVRAEEAVPYLGIAQVSQAGTSDGVLTDCELRLTAKITSPTYSASNPEPFVRSPSNWPREPKNCCRTELQVIRACIWSHADVIAAADSTIGRSTAGQRQHSGSGQPVGPAGPFTEAVFEALQEVVEGLVRRPGLVGGDGGGNRKIVLSTLIDAADRDYRVYVLTDGVADHHPDVHRILLDHVFPSRAHLIDTAQLAELLKAARPPRA